jgi:hypothetical protein
LPGTGGSGFREAVVIPSFTPRTVNSIAKTFEAASTGSDSNDSAAFAKSRRECIVINLPEIA